MLGKLEVLSAISSANFFSLQCGNHINVAREKEYVFSFLAKHRILNARASILSVMVLLHDTDTLLGGHMDLFKELF